MRQSLKDIEKDLQDENYHARIPLVCKNWREFMEFIQNIKERRNYGC